MSPTTTCHQERSCWEVADCRNRNMHRLYRQGGSEPKKLIQVFRTDLAYSSWKAIQASHRKIAIAASTLILWIWNEPQVELLEQVLQSMWACPEQDFPRRWPTRHILGYDFVLHLQKTTEKHQTFRQRSASCSSSLQEPARTIHCACWIRQFAFFMRPWCSGWVDNCCPTKDFLCSTG